MNVQADENALIELKKQLTPINAGKFIFGTLISIGATAAIVALFKNPLKASRGIMKILMAAGIFMLASKAGDIAEEHFKETVDNWADTFSDIQEEIKEEGEKEDGNDSHAGRDSGKQPQKQGNSSTAADTFSAGKAAGAAIRRRWWSKAERTKQDAEVVQKDVPE